MAQPWEQAHKAASRFLRWILGQACKTFSEDCLICSLPPEKTLYEGFPEALNKKESPSVRDDWRILTTDERILISPNMHRPVKDEGPLLPEPAVVEASALHSHTLGHNRRSRLWSTPLVLATSLKNTSPDNDYVNSPESTISLLTANSSSRSPSPVESEDSANQRLDALGSDTESTVSESEAEQDKNEGAEAEITKEWENILRLKESAHQTEIEILNDEHKADKEFLEKSLNSEIERLKRNMKVQKQTIDKKLTKLSTDSTQKDALIESKDALLRKAEADSLDIKTRNAALWKGVMRCIPQMTVLKKQVRELECMLYNMHPDYYKMSDRLNGAIAEKKWLKKNLDDFHSHFLAGKPNCSEGKSIRESMAAKLEQVTALLEADDTKGTYLRMVNKAGAENASLKAQLESRIKDIQYLYYLKGQYDNNMVALHNTHQWMVNDAVQGLITETGRRLDLQDTYESLKNDFEKLKAEKERLGKIIATGNQKPRTTSSSSQQALPAFPGHFVPGQRSNSFGKKTHLDAMSNMTVDSFSLNFPPPSESPEEQRRTTSFQRTVPEAKTAVKQDPFGGVFQATTDPFMDRFKSQFPWHQAQPAGPAQPDFETNLNKETSGFPFPNTSNPSMKRSEPLFTQGQEQSEYHSSYDTTPEAEAKSKQEGFISPFSATSDSFTQQPAPQAQWQQEIPRDKAGQETAAEAEFKQPQFNFSIPTPSSPFMKLSMAQLHSSQEQSVDQASHGTVPNSENKFKWNNFTGRAKYSTQTSTATLPPNATYGNPRNNDAASSQTFPLQNENFSSIWDQTSFKMRTGSNTMANTPPDVEQIVDPNVQGSSINAMEPSLPHITTGTPEFIIEPSIQEPLHEYPPSDQNESSPLSSQGLPKPHKNKKEKNKQRKALRKAAKARARDTGAAVDADGDEKMSSEKSIWKMRLLL
ncbi:hypothetical protein ABVK25_006320 [Lepraria finkii]|uniref:Uncharacterized protein n=1 Tax=Lepraria finkii TaxID=1340010 RepID=A0ABR4B8Y8_9LECA